MSDETLTTAEPFRCIMIDPPWFEKGGGKIKRGADRHYPIMRYPEIISLVQKVLGYYGTDGRPRVVAASAHLWLWATDNHLLDALHVVEALGFRYVRTMVWCKFSSAGKLQTGLGQYMRGSHELCLFAVHGPTCKPATANRQPSVVLAPRRLHSQKPDEAYRAIEMTSPGPRLELFARYSRPGWVAWGDEAP